MAELLQVNGLETQFQTREGVVHAVNGVSFNFLRRRDAGHRRRKRMREKCFYDVSPRVNSKPAGKSCRR